LPTGKSCQRFVVARGDGVIVRTAFTPHYLIWLVGFLGHIGAVDWVVAAAGQSGLDSMLSAAYWNFIVMMVWGWLMVPVSAATPSSRMVNVTAAIAPASDWCDTVPGAHLAEHR